MKKFNPKLRDAVTTALMIPAVSIGGISIASAHTIYNTYNAHSVYTPTDAGGSGTDGWVWGFTANSPNNSASAIPGFVGTPGGAAPFNYVGKSVVNWAAMLHSGGESLEISQQDAFDHYGVYADIDTAGGAWLDAESNPQGWRHNTDIGLFKSDVTQYVHLNLSAINGPIANFGVTVFEGMDTSLTAYGHHGTWNNTFASSPYIPVGAANPFGTTGLETVIGWDDSVDSVNGFTFLAQADTIYSIYLGGSGGLHWNQQHDGYVLNITSSPVPIPAAAWLLGSGLLGLIGMQRRKR